MFKITRGKNKFDFGEGKKYIEIKPQMLHILSFYVQQLKTVNEKKCMFIILVNWIMNYCQTYISPDTYLLSDFVMYYVEIKPL